MGSVLDLLKHLPEAAKSPLAFIAYCLVIAAWVLQQWFASKPQREAKAILLSMRDDRAKVDAITDDLQRTVQILEASRPLLPPDDAWIKTVKAVVTKPS